MDTTKRTISDLIQDVTSTFARYETTGTNRWSYKTAVIDLQYQLGMLAKYVMLLDGDRLDENIACRELQARISDELVDILADVLFISHELNVDLPTAWKKMLASDDRKIDARAARLSLKYNRSA